MALGIVYGQSLDLALSFVMKICLLTWPLALFMDSLWTWPSVLLWKLSLDMALGIVYGQSLDLALSFVMEIVS